MAAIGEGHEKAIPSSYRTDGLRDTDVLASPTLTNFNERGLFNGVVPVTINDYDTSGNPNRNSSTAGNGVVTLSGSAGSSSTLVAATGTVLLDGLFHTLTAVTIDITSSSHQAKFISYNDSTLPPLTGANYERILLVYVDPRITGNIGLVYGSEIDTSGGAYPQSPSNHLDRQTIVLASVRLSYNSGVKIASIEDKRVFIRPGPLPLSSLNKDGGGSGTASSLANDLISGINTGNLPVTNMGALFARDPVGLGGTPDGGGQTHLFYQSDAAVGQASGGSYQITPVHRTSLKHLAWAPGSQKVVTFGTDILFKPLTSQDTNSLYLLDILAYDDDASGSKKYLGHLVQTEDYTVSSSAITIPANSQYSTASHIEIRYIHAGHT